MTTPVSAFHATMMRNAIAAHETATSHDAFCCETAKRYQSLLGEAEIVSGAKPTDWARGIRQFDEASTVRDTSVKMASPRQLNLVKSLLNDRKCSDEERELWSGMAEVGMTSREVRPIIDTLLKRPFLVKENGTQDGTKPNAKQIRYLKALLSERVWDHEVDFEALTFRATSMLIDQLKEAPKKAAEEVSSSKEGFYYVDGLFVKVQRAIHTNGRYQVKAFDTETGRWEHKRGLLNKLTEDTRLKAEHAKEFSRITRGNDALYGRCIRCHLPLTNEDSINDGIGPKCKTKMGF